MTRLEVGDLLRMPVQKGRYDLIMCRNTVIHFTEEVRDALHARLADALSPGGHLVVGTSERVAGPAALGPELGQRNETAVRELLHGLRIPVRAAAAGTVTYREAGGQDTLLYGDIPMAVAA